MKITYKTKPWPHQVRVLKRMIRQRGGGIQVPMRWGKTWVAIYWAVAMHELENVDRVLVVTVTSGLGVWESEIAKHCPISYRILTHHGECVEVYGHPPYLNFMIVNFPNVYGRARTGEGASWVVVENQVLKKFKPQAVVIDESHHIGDPTTETSKYVYKLRQGAPFRLFMTGTMFHRKPFYTFGQVKFYDDGKTFGSAWGHFKKKIAVFGGYMGYKVVAYRNLKWMMTKVREFTHIERYVPPRPPVMNRIEFRLEGTHLKRYQAMERSKVLKVGDETVTAEIILTHHLRLLQIAGGFIKGESGYKQVGDSKLKVCEDRLREYLEQYITKAVVGCRFLPELLGVAKIAKKIGFVPVVYHGSLNKAKRVQRERFFQQTDKPCLFITQIQAASESIDLSAASVMMFYSLVESYVVFDQFCRRIETYGEKRVLMYDFLLAKGTRDVVTYEAMQLKMDVAKYLVTNPKRVEQLTWR